jgi:hypothetical protein
VVQVGVAGFSARISEMWRGAGHVGKDASLRTCGDLIVEGSDGGSLFLGIMSFWNGFFVSCQ